MRTPDSAKVNLIQPTSPAVALSTPEPPTLGTSVATPQVTATLDTRIRTDDYEDRVRYQRFLLDTRLLNLQTLLTRIDPEEQGNEFLIQYYQQLADQTRQQRLAVDQQTVDDMVEEELVRQKAAEVGLSVSEDEVDEAIRAGVAAMSGFLTETQATAVASTAVAATATTETFTATPEPTSTQALTVTLVTTATPTAVPEIPTPAPTPTYHIITEDEFSQNYVQFLDIVNERTGLSEAKYRQIIKAGLLVDKLRQHFADQVPTEAEQVNVSYIQVDTQEEAQAALERLDAGEEFALVASEVSTDTFTAANGGELGWVLEGDLASRYGPALEEAAFALSPGEYSQPISSTLGVHIILVNERGLRPLDEYRLQAQRQQAYFEWLQEAQIAQSTLLPIAIPTFALPPAKKGGLQLLLEADITPGQEGNFDAHIMEAARVIIDCRARELGVTEPLVQLQGEQRIIMELPGIEDPDQVIATLRETGMLEFIEAGRLSLQEGDLIRTSLDVASAEADPTTSEVLTSAQYAYDGQIFTTIMAGRHLRNAEVITNNLGQAVIAFELTDEGTKIFHDYTTQHVGDIVAIVLDKKVVSAPVINEPIISSRGIISSNQLGGFPLEEAQDIASKMKCGALPVLFREVEVRPIATP